VTGAADACANTHGLHYIVRGHANGLVNNEDAGNCVF
jgi:hypothetical protein